MDVQFAKWTSSEKEFVNRVLSRALAYQKKHDLPPSDRMSLEMDLAAVHVHTPLNFGKLLSFPDFDFTHDVFGIAINIDRETGELRNHFLPRCARPQITDPWTGLEPRVKHLLRRNGFETPDAAFQAGRDALVGKAGVPDGIDGFGVKAWVTLCEFLGQSSGVEVCAACGKPR